MKTFSSLRRQPRNVCGVARGLPGRAFLALGAVKLTSMGHANKDPAMIGVKDLLGRGKDLATPTVSDRACKSFQHTMHASRGGEHIGSGFL